MGGGIESRGEPIVFSGRPGLYDKLLVKINRDHGFMVGLTEIPEAYTSLYPIVDFVVDDKFSQYVSFLEKIVIKDIYRVPPMAFAVIGFYNSCGDEYVDEMLGGFYDSDFRLWTVQWYWWDVKPILVDNYPLFDYILSNSTYVPSNYRPELLNDRFRFRDKLVKIFNYYSFNEWVSTNNLKNLLGSCEGLEGYVIFPPNFLNIDRFTNVSTLYRLFYFEYFRLNDYYHEFRNDDMYSYVLNLYRDLFGDICSMAGKIVFPYFYCVGDRLSIFYIYYDGDWGVVDSPVFEETSFVIDPFNMYRGSRMKVYFGLWRRVVYRKGFSIIMYLNFSGYKVVQSRMFYEARYGGKIIYSSPSRLGLL